MSIISLLNNLSKEQKFIIFISILLLIVIIRLFYLQIVKADYYQKILYTQHFKTTTLEAKRGNIYLINENGKKIPLTENIRLYNIYADPKFIKNPEKVAKLLTPFIYKHLCIKNGINEIKETEVCIKNIESYTNTIILPKEKTKFITSGDQKYLILNYKEYKEEKEKIISNWGTGKAYPLIEKVLTEKLTPGIKKYNYIGFFDNPNLIKELEKLNFVQIRNNYYIYLMPSNSLNKENDAKILYKIFRKYGYFIDYEKIYLNLLPKEKRYIILAKEVSADLKLKIENLKKKYYNEKIDGIPIMHGIGFEQTWKRYYPFGKFLAHVIGYIDINGKPKYGVEEFFDDILKGKNGKIQGASTPWLGTVGSNKVKVIPSQDGFDIYLTIDFIIQKKLEEFLKKYHQEFKADSISAIIIDPYTGKIKAMANYPNFDPNNYSQEYKIRLLTPEEQYLIQDDTYIDIPILIETGGNLKVATYNERKDPKYKKYIFRNLLGPQIFVDKNIAFPYEPGSVFKTFTLAIGIDSDSISLYQYYHDKGYAQVGPYKIKNVAKECMGTNTFLHALEWSCNVGMIKIVNKIGKFVFYNYLERLGFGQKTGIELAGEQAGKVDGLNNFSKARFFNNSFGQGLNVTPIQLAIGYSAMVNGGYLIKPTIVEKIYNPNNKEYKINKKIIKNRIFKKKTTEDIKLALYKVIYEGDLPSLKIQPYTVGGKTGTSQISFKGKYQRGNGWTNGSFVGIVTKDDLKYVIVIQVRRPRTCQWGACTAGKIFKDIASFIIKYKNIKK